MLTLKIYFYFLLAFLQIISFRTHKHTPVIDICELCKSSI